MKAVVALLQVVKAVMALLQVVKAMVENWEGGKVKELVVQPGSWMVWLAYPESGLPPLLSALPLCLAAPGPTPTVDQTIVLHLYSLSSPIIILVHST